VKHLSSGDVEVLNWHNVHTVQSVCVPQLPNPQSLGCSGPLSAPPLATNPGLLQGIDPQKLSKELQRRVSLLQALQHQARLQSLPGQLPASFPTPMPTQLQPAMSGSLSNSALPPQYSRCGTSHAVPPTVGPSRAVRNISASLRGAAGCRAPQLTPAEAAAGMAHVLHNRSGRGSFASAMKVQTQATGRGLPSEALDLSKLHCSLRAGALCCPHFTVTR
jgi:hypothetical protein